MPKTDDLLLPAHIEIIKYGEALTKDYFYIPCISYSDSELEDRYNLVFELDEGTTTNTAYASKVKAGETLWQAVRRDLEKDFAYPKDDSIMIEGVYLHDTAINTEGITLGRVIVDVTVDKFDIMNVFPLGMKILWREEALLED